MAGLSASRNDTLELYVADPALHLRNGTVIFLRTQPKFQDTDLNELLYVVVVIMFYAIALMVLIATQIKRQKREGEEDYYDEYLQRNTAIYQNKQMQQKMMQKVQEQKANSEAAAAARLNANMNKNTEVNAETNSHVNSTSTVHLESIPDEEV